MAQIRIIESDTTGLTPGATSNTIFCVVPAADSSGKGAATIDSIEILTEDNIDKTLGTTPNAARIKELFKLGGTILVANTWSKATDYLLDRNQCDVKFLLCNASDNKEAETTTLELAAKIAATRRDCAVIYGRNNCDKYSDAEKSIFDSNLISNDDTYLAAEKIDAKGKYIISADSNSLKTGNDGVACEFAWMNAYLTMVANGVAEWLTVAGSERGAISIDNLTCGPITETQLNSMQSSKAGTYGNNPILTVNPWGIRIWGTRTALKIPETGICASNFANIRVLLCDLKKQLYKASKKYQFEQNTDVLWTQYKSYVNVLLEEMKLSYGIAGYRWEKVTSATKAADRKAIAGNKLSCKLYIVPIEPVDDFDVEITLSDTLTVTE